MIDVYGDEGFYYFMLWTRFMFKVIFRHYEKTSNGSASFFHVVRRHHMEQPTIWRNLWSMNSCIYLINLWETSSFLRNLSLIRCGKLKSEAINKALLTSSCEETADFESKKLQPNSQCCAILDVAISMIYCWPAGIKFGMQNGCEIWISMFTIE